MNKLRSYDLETGRLVWDNRGGDDEPDPVAGRGRWDGVRHERVPRQQPQGHSTR